VELSAWESFRAELERNLSPNEQMIREQYIFLCRNDYCDAVQYEKLVQVRLMASYESCINSFLHPAAELKQGNLKAETIHLGTIVEALLKMVIDKMYRDGKLTMTDIRAYAKTYPKSITFMQSIDLFYLLADFDREFRTMLHELRAERNKVHLSVIQVLVDGEYDFEEFRVIRFRRKMEYLLERMRSGTIEKK